MSTADVIGLIIQTFVDIFYLSFPVILMMMFSHAFSSELDHCCCVWHLVLLIPIHKLENDFLCNHASNWAVLFLKWFVFEHGDFPLNSPLWNVLIWILIVKFMSCLHFSIFKIIFHLFLSYLHSGSLVLLQWLPCFSWDTNCNMVLNTVLAIQMINAKRVSLIFLFGKK